MSEETPTPDEGDETNGSETDEQNDTTNPPSSELEPRHSILNKIVQQQADFVTQLQEVKRKIIKRKKENESLVKEKEDEISRLQDALSDSEQNVTQLKDGKEALIISSWQENVSLGATQCIWKAVGTIFLMIWNSCVTIGIQILVGTGEPVQPTTSSDGGNS